MNATGSAGTRAGSSGRWLHRIGQVCEDLLEMDKAYSSAREAVSYRAVYGTSRAINIQEVAPQEISRFDSPKEAEVSGLFKVIRMVPGKM